MVRSLSPIAGLSEALGGPLPFPARQRRKFVQVAKVDHVLENETLSHISGFAVDFMGAFGFIARKQALAKPWKLWLGDK